MTGRCSGLRVEDLDVDRGGRPILRGVGLCLNEGEAGVVLGPNGAGKTTLLEAVLGALKPSKGLIAVAGRTVYSSLHGIDLPPEERQAAYVPQDYGLFPHLTVYENIAFPLRARRRPEEETRSRVRELAEMLGIENLLNTYPGGLSGGQKQRVALARALAAEPRLLLLDEPFSALDAPTREAMRPLLRRIVRETGTTTLMVTHSFSDAWSIADRIHILTGGRLGGGATPEELARHPLRYGAARLLGYHVLQARAVDDRHVEAEAIGVLELGEPHGLQPGSGLLIAFRGDDIVLNPPPGTPNRFRAVVEDTVLTRYSVRLRLRLASGLVLTAEQPRGLVALQQTLVPGREVWISIPPSVIDAAAPGENEPH